MVSMGILANFGLYVSVNLLLLVSQALGLAYRRLRRCMSTPNSSSHVASVQKHSKYEEECREDSQKQDTDHNLIASQNILLQEPIKTVRKNGLTKRMKRAKQIEG